MRLIDADQLLNFIKFDERVIAPEEHTAKDIVMMIQTAQTIALPPNNQLTISELREMDEPVWVECGVTPFTPNGGYYCLCKFGEITAPSGGQFDIEEIPHWKFYRRKPDEEKLVRCMDCKHLYFKDFSAFCPRKVGACRPDGFCEYGERRKPEGSNET